MKKTLLSAIAIIGITSGVSLAAQNNELVTKEVPTHETHHIAAAETNGDTPAVHHQMAKSMGNMQGHGEMRGKSSMMDHGKMGEKSKMMSHGMMGGKKKMMKDHSMKCGMSGEMEHGKKGGHNGMKAHGMSGIGFHMPGQESWTTEQTELFLANTGDIRKELIVKRYEISEAKRDKNTTPDQLGKLDKELIEIRTKLQNKALEINAS